MKKISVCIPCFNEEDNLIEAYERVRGVLDNLSGYDYEIVFADNASSDKSQSIIRNIAAKDKMVKAIFNAANVGAGPSGTNCLLRSTGDAAILLPCDMQDPPELIPELIKEWEGGASVVLGCKTASEEHAIMYACRKVYYKILDILSDNTIYHQADGYGLYDRSVLNASSDFCDKYTGLKSFVSIGVFPVATVAYSQSIRKKGKSSYNFGSYFNLAFSTAIENSTKVFSMLFNIALLFLSLSIIGFISLAIYKTLSGEALTQGINIFIPIGFCFLSFQLLVSALVGAYVARIKQKMRRAPLVIEKETIGFQRGE